MPSTGRPSASRARSASSSPCAPQLVHRRARRADARQHGEIGARDVVDELGAEPAQRDLDRADVPGAVVADGDLHSIPFVDGMPADSARTAVRSARPTALYAASAVWCASRPVASTWIAIRPACARRGEEVPRHPGLGLERELGERPAAEIDGGARERVVHRHDRVAVARDPAPVAERAVERLAERERGVLDRVVVAGLEVAGALDDEVEPGVEGELLEEVVVDAGAGLRRETRLAPSRPSRTAIRVSAVARRWRTLRPPRAGDRRRPVEQPRERLDEQVVVDRGRGS